MSYEPRTPPADTKARQITDQQNAARQPASPSAERGSAPTPEEIADHRIFLASVTSIAVAKVRMLVDPRALPALDYELELLVDAAMEQGRFDERFPEEQPHV